MVHHYYSRAHRRRASLDLWQNRYEMNFDGFNETVNIDSVRAALASTTKGTMSIRVKPVDATPASNKFIIGFGDTDANEVMQLWMATDGKIVISFTISGTIQWTVRTNAAVMSDNTRTHVLFTQPSDGNGPVIYVDGTKPNQTIEDSTSLNAWFNDASGLDNGRIGAVNRNNSGDVAHFLGTMDEPRFWDIDLSTAEALDDHNNGVSKKPLQAGLVTNYRFGDGSDNWDGSKWNFIDPKGGHDGFSVNMEEEDRILI